MKDLANYSFERAFEEDAFLQLPLITWEQFGRYAKERGVSLSIGSTLREQLQELDRAGALRPIAFRIPGPPGYDELVFREGVEFKEWHEYPSGNELWPQRVLYCHWQLLYVKDAVELGIAEVSIDWFLGPTRKIPAASTGRPSPASGPGPNALLTSVNRINAPHTLPGGPPRWPA